jgi:hypothetical protein
VESKRGINMKKQDFFLKQEKFIINDDLVTIYIVTRKKKSCNYELHETLFTTVDKNLAFHIVQRLYDMNIDFYKEIKITKKYLINIEVL